MPKLNDLKAKNAKPKEKQYKLYDEAGLHLLIKPNGSKLWHWKYSFEGKEKTYSIGIYPETSLSVARGIRDGLRSTRAEGIDPMEAKRKDNIDGTFLHEVATAWFDFKRQQWRESYKRTQEGRLKKHILPRFGKEKISEIKRSDIIKTIKMIEANGTYETAHRTLNILSDIFNYAANLEIVELNPCFGIEALLIPVKHVSRASITDLKGVGALMRNIDEYDGTITVRIALAFSALTFCRSNEIRAAEWSEIDFDKKLWTIPLSRAKMKKPHLVPLSRQAIELLEKIVPFSGYGKYIFPGTKSQSSCMSESAILSAIRRMGYDKEEMSAHGFRSMASTLLNEKGYKFDVIEAQLAHEGYDKIRAIYNRAQYMEERTQLMQSWADYLDELRSIR